MKLCDYGCGQKAIHQFKNGKWCCSESFNSCLELRKKNSKVLTGENNPMYGKTLSKERRKKLSEALKGKTPSEETRKKISEALKGKNNPMFGKTHSIETKQKMSKNHARLSGISHHFYGKTHSKETRKKLSLANKGKTPSEETRKKMRVSSANKLNIKKIKKLYPLFAQIEDMRYNPDKPEEREVQVHCKYNECPNSKKNNGWFTPTQTQRAERIRQLEQVGKDNSYFYCSDECKNSCSLYRIKSYQNKEQLYTSEEYETFRQEVLKRQIKTEGYNFCEYCYSEENLHVHHEKPQKTNPLLVLDPDNGVVLCKDCHYIIGHQDECSTGNLSKKVC